MGEAYRAWLPPEAFADAAVDRRLSEAVEQWSLKWFADRTVRRLGGEARGALPGDPQVHSLEDGLAVAVDGDARTAIAGAMLDAAIDLKKAKPADRRLFDRLSAACLEDLRSRLAQAFKLGPDARWRAGDRTDGFEPGSARAFAFDDAHEPLLVLFVTRELEVTSIKSALRSPAPPTPLQPLAAGLAAQQVDMSALLGRCDLTVAELAGLTRGDVLVLDRALDLPLDLALNGQVRRGQCTVEQDGDQLRLKITRTFTG